MCTGYGIVDHKHEYIEYHDEASGNGIGLMVPRGIIEAFSSCWGSVKCVIGYSKATKVHAHGVSNFMRIL